LSDRRSGITLLALAALAAMLVLPNIGATSLWQDEAQTAVVAKNLLARGYPAARGERGLVSIFSDHRDLRGDVYIWQPWLPVYLAAGSIALLGADSFAARLPFALCFVALVGVAYTCFRRWRADGFEALLGALLILTSVPMLLHARQCRYYTLAALLILLVADAYLRLLEKPGWRRAALLILWMTLLFNSFYPGALLTAAAIGLHWLLRRADLVTLKYLGSAAAGFVIMNLPLAIYCRIWDRQFGFQPGYSDPWAFALYLLRYLLTINNYFVPLVLVLAVVVWKGRAMFRRRWLEDDFTILAMAICGTHLLGSALLSDYPFTRYLIGMAPFLMFLAARCLRALSPGRHWPALLLLLLMQSANLLHVAPTAAIERTEALDMLWNAAAIGGPPDQRNVGLHYAKREIEMLVETPLGSPFSNYAGALVRSPAGPIDGLVEYLGREAGPEDRVKIAYGDLPLMFHTKLNVVSASEVGPPAPEWIIPRRAHQLKTSKEFDRGTPRERYSAVELPVVDLPWNNRPDPLYHRYRRPADDEGPPLTLYRRR
jgi:hypothetical protein